MLNSDDRRKVLALGTMAEGASMSCMSEPSARGRAVVSKGPSWGKGRSVGIDCWSRGLDFILTQEPVLSQSVVVDLRIPFVVLMRVVRH